MTRQSPPLLPPWTAMPAQPTQEPFVPPPRIPLPPDAILVDPSAHPSLCNPPFAHAFERAARRPSADGGPGFAARLFAGARLTLRHLPHVTCIRPIARRSPAGASNLDARALFDILARHPAKLSAALTADHVAVQVTVASPGNGSTTFSLPTDIVMLGTPPPQNDPDPLIALPVLSTDCDATPDELAAVITDACFRTREDGTESSHAQRSRFHQRACRLVRNIRHGPTTATDTTIARLIHESADWTLSAHHRERIHIRRRTTLRRRWPHLHPRLNGDPPLPQKDREPAPETATWQFLMEQAERNCLICAAYGGYAILATPAHQRRTPGLRASVLESHNRHENDASRKPPVPQPAASAQPVRDTTQPRRTSTGQRTVPAPADTQADDAFASIVEQARTHGFLHDHTEITALLMIPECAAEIPPDSRHQRAAP